MKIRPRLLVISLVIALVVSVGAGYLIARSGDDEPDAVLDNPQTVETFPNNGLGNDVVEGDLLPVTTLFDRDDNEVLTTSLLGQPTVVNFWFSTCPPCAKELPDFAEVHSEVGDDVRFVGVNTIDSVESMERFAGERGVTYEQLRDPFAELTDAIGAVAFPVTLFVTSDGTIIEQTGVLDADQLRDRVDELQAVEAQIQEAS
ncbi:MAG: TlpA family protein disulfide reductase [Ilumatobacteraceae bacterium]|nr:TlpA family protein disulfide reductase [Ilumatobacteraceae bacterium]